MDAEGRGSVFRVSVVMYSAERKNAGVRAHKKLMLCEGLYVGTGIPFYDEYYGYK